MTSNSTARIPATTVEYPTMQNNCRRRSAQHRTWNSGETYLQTRGRTWPVVSKVPFQDTGMSCLWNLVDRENGSSRMVSLVVGVAIIISSREAALGAAGWIVPASSAVHGPLPVTKKISDCILRTTPNLHNPFTPTTFHSPCFAVVFKLKMRLGEGYFHSR
jgi:hypothetical protein